MSHASDLLAHLRPCPVLVNFLGVEYRIEAMDAVEWVALIGWDNADLYEIFPRLAGLQAVEAVEDALWDRTATMDDVAKVGLEAIGAAADRPWWVTLRLLNSATQAWDFVHVNAAGGKSLAGWLDEVWSKIRERVDPKKWNGWVAQIEKAPKGYVTEIDFDEEEQAFLAAMNAVMK